MFESVKGRIDALKQAMTENKPQPQPNEHRLTGSLPDDMVTLRAMFSNSSDFLTREITIAGVPAAFLMIEGMVNLQTMSEMLLEPLLSHRFPSHAKPQDICDYIENRTVLAADTIHVYSCEQVFRMIMSGFVVLLIDKIPYACAYGMQGFSFRSVSEPSAEVNELGSREGFTEPLRINMSMVRRRIKSPSLKFDLFPIGRVSQTDICLIYMTDRVSKSLLRQLKRKLSSISLDVVLTSGYLKPFLSGTPWSLFPDVSTTERPDVLCAKIQEGRVAILIDGTPFALVVPCLFTENFQSLDDYAHSAFYASFVRIIKYVSFFVSILLPGIYVAVSTFHPELLPHALLFNIAAAEETTPFPIGIEALIIHFLYEIMREAGLRLPRPIGHAVSIVGALVIGDAAVTAGLIGAPMVMIVATTAIASFVVPPLYEAISVLRFFFILVGMSLGLYGIILFSLVLFVNVCAKTSFGIPITAPVSPFSLSAMRDTFIRLSFRTLQKKTASIERLNGVSISASEKESTSNTNTDPSNHS